MMAPSGGGKSTAARILEEFGLRILGDDSTVVCRGTDGTWRVIPCASWTWRSGLPRDAVELGAVILLEKGEPPLRSRLSPLYASYRILREDSVLALSDLEPGERPGMRRGVRELTGSFPVYMVRYTEPESLMRMVMACMGTEEG